MLRTFNAVLVTALLSIAIFYTPASAQAADSPAVVEAYGCTFNEGQGMADLEKAIEYYASQRSKIDSPELQKLRSVLWTPYRGSVGADFVWFNTNTSFAEWGALNKVYDDSSVGQAIQARFDEVSTCSTSGLYLNESLFRNELEFSGDGVMIESFRCNLHPGKSIADSDAAIATWRPVFEKATKMTNSASFVGRRQPIISGSGFDLSYIAVWDDVAAYANGNSAFRSDPNSARSDELFAEAHVCVSALFNGRVVVQPDE